MRNDDKIKYWLEIAQYDIVSAKAMLETKRYLYVGFLCHQVIEKALKAAVWARKKSEPPFTHNLMILAENADLLAKLNDDQKLLLSELMPLNI
jgi:HEPN domain-containing protein